MGGIRTHDPSVRAAKNIREMYPLSPNNLYNKSIHAVRQDKGDLRIRTEISIVFLSSSRKTPLL
jgi:hypothetical protein